jgi:hypothetical protein
VVSTSNRHAARLGIMKSFVRQLERFAQQRTVSHRVQADVESSTRYHREHVTAMVAWRSRCCFRVKAFIQLLFMLIVAFAYARQTWEFRWMESD